jgi:hypothetical protein
VRPAGTLHQQGNPPKQRGEPILLALGRLETNRCRAATRLDELEDERASTLLRIGRLKAQLEPVEKKMKQPRVRKAQREFERHNQLSQEKLRLEQLVADNTPQPKYFLHGNYYEKQGRIIVGKAVQIGPGLNLQGGFIFIDPLPSDFMLGLAGGVVHADRVYWIGTLDGAPPRNVFSRTLEFNSAGKAAQRELARVNSELDRLDKRLQPVATLADQHALLAGLLRVEEEKLVAIEVERRQLTSRKGDVQ